MQCILLYLHNLLGHHQRGIERIEEEKLESLHSTLVESLFDEEEALLNMHMNVIQGGVVCVYTVCLIVY